MMTSHLKQLALAKLKEERKAEFERDRAFNRLPRDAIRAFTEQEGWTFFMDPAAGRDRQVQADNALFAGHLLEQAQRDQPRPVKEVKVYRGPGYPVDPELENRREFRAYRSPFVWNLP